MIINFLAPAFAFKGIAYDQIPVNLIKDGGQQVQYRLPRSTLMQIWHSTFYAFR